MHAIIKNLPLSAAHRLLAAAVLVLLSILPVQQAGAQGLGELSLDSTLNEPLSATIDLLDVAGLNENQIVVSLAGPEDYEEYGLERPALAGDIDFTVELFPLGRGQVMLSTEERITEPFLSLLVSARFPSGRVLRDYTLLIDLPNLNADDNAPQGANAGVDAAQAGDLPAGSQQSYTVQSGDSLWEIAEQTRPSTDITVQQMMIAIQRANEDAFVNNNVNRLLNGRVLRIPTQREIGIIAHSAAVAQIDAQNEALGLMRVVGTTEAPRPEPERDELTILSAEDAEVDEPEEAQEDNQDEDLAATIAALENELMLSEEDLDRARLENQELTSRLNELEEQIEILQNIIAIEDERIAQLQSELAEQAEATAAALAEAENAAATLEQARRESEAEPEGFADRVVALLQNNLILLGAGFFLVLLVLVLLLYRFRSGGDAAEDEELDLSPAEGPAAASGATPSGEEGQQGQEGKDGQEGQEGEPKKGLLASLLALFGRKKQDSDETEEPAAESVPLAEAAAGLQQVDDDEESAQGADEDVAEPELGDVDLDDDLDDLLDADDEEEDDAEELAGSLLGEVDESLLPEFESSSPDDEDDEVSGFDDSDTDFGMDDDSGDRSRAADQAQSDNGEAFEFSLDETEAEPASAAADDAGADIESVDFTLEPEAAASAEPSEETENLEFGGAESAAAGKGLDFDLGNLSFDENDVRAEVEDDEADYQDRTDMDECDTKLDLAVAYEAMGDIEGALEILEEVITEGKPEQIEEAERLKAKWQTS